MQTGKPVRMERVGEGWTLAGLRLTTALSSADGEPELSLTLHAETTGLLALTLRWDEKAREGTLCLGDHWERAYGDLEWRGLVPNRAMPWYFLSLEGDRVSGYGVKTPPAAFCFWQRDASGITLSLDLRNGGSAADLRGRPVAVCTVVWHAGMPGQSIHEAGQALCRRMCPKPRLPASPLYGLNDWNYAYGHNTASGILRDADLIASLAPRGDARPHIVIDDGWQDRSRFPDMTHLAGEIRGRNLHPGLWIRPLRAPREGTPGPLLPAARFGRNGEKPAPAFDPTHPEGLQQVLRSVADPVGWGYTLLKHDFSTWELFGRWGSHMGDQITAEGWNFHDPTRTNAEIVTGFYRALRQAAGEQTTLLGCNTVGHLSAGIFESQRIGDDTSGRDWERTRRMGVNALAQRACQHRTFFHIDPDCVAITRDVGWNETRAWMDVVARTGTSLFLSPAPEAVTPEAKAAMRDAMTLVVQSQGGAPLHPAASTTPQEWVFANGARRSYEWTRPDTVVPAGDV